MIWIVATCLLSNMTACLPHQSHDGEDDELIQIKNTIKFNYNSFQNMYVEYEVYEGTSSKNLVRKLFISDAIAGRRRWQRTVHFYGELYDNSNRPELDPSLNWITWDGERRVFLNVTTRQAVISDMPRTAARIPLIIGYFGYSGILTPDRYPDLLIKEEAHPPWKLADYYLPYCLDRPGWLVVSSVGSESGTVLIERHGPFGRDQIRLDKSHGFSLMYREIREESGRLILSLKYHEPRQAADGLWLPMRIVARTSSPEMLELRVKKLQANSDLAVRAVQPDLPAGTLVSDDRTGEKFLLPRGEDLLLFTIERMQFLLNSYPQNSHGVSDWSMATIFWATVGMSICCVFYLRHLVRNKFSTFVDK